MARKNDKECAWLVCALYYATIVICSVDAVDWMGETSGEFTTNNLTLTGDKTLTGSLTITGPGENQWSQITAKSGNYRHFRVTNTVHTLTLTYLKFVGGSITSGSNGNTGTSAYGGSIHATAGNIVINKCEFSGNSNFNQGGAIYVAGASLTIANSIFKDNEAGWSAAAIYFNSPTGTLDVRGTLFQGNEQTSNGPWCAGGGGAMYISGGTTTTTHIIEDTTFTNNKAACGSGHVS